MMQMSRRNGFRLLAGAAAALAFAAGPAAAQEWPTRPVKIVIAVGPGSTGDLIARTLAPKLEAVWKQPVIVENRPGAGGIVGTEHVVNATDGHTLLFASTSSMLPKFTAKALRFDPYADLVPVYKFIEYQHILTTNAETAKKAKTLREFVALSKTAPVFFAGIGPTSVYNGTLAVVNKSMGVKYSTVDFNSVSAMNLALMRNDAQFAINTPSAVLSQIEAGQLAAYAVIGTERYAKLPNVPTLAQAGVGFNGYIPMIWGGFMAPKNMPAGSVERIARDVLAIASDPSTTDPLEARFSGKVQKSSPAQFAKENIEEGNVWKELFQSMNFKPE
ncbi:Bug family tripartite tricarboxylate transporter substrate binding protein [Ramlibacter sp.]|uniref:Bug family tripartite tricarboxylate transporter substrate binding protein n=1 Tax=Ramlibacter sp. TaxID=1917967 RepID=UPI003D10E4EB